MKKFLSLMIALTMLTSLAALFAVPASAVDGQWIVYSYTSPYKADFDPSEFEPSPVPGYSYVSGEGLVVTPADWRDYTPSFGIQTKEKVNLKDGVYILIRIDDFTYANDKWFTYSIADTQYLSIGSSNIEKYGELLTALMRPNDAGQINSIQWNKSNFQSSGTNAMSYTDEQKYDENGKPLLEMVVTWDSAKSTYDVKINGTSAPQDSIDWMNEHFANGEGYIGMNIRNGNKGGTAALTVLKFGTDKETAITPSGDDFAEPENHYATIAEIADPETVEAGKPAIFMNGSRELSDSKNTTKKTNTTSLADDYSIHFAADRANQEIGFSVKNEVSYNLADFPIIMVLTRNLCTCGMDECIALESANMYIMSGETTAASDSYKVNELSMCYDPIIKGDDSYLYFFVDMEADAGWDYAGRFNGARFDIKGVQYDIPGLNAFDVCWLALFRNIEEAESFVMDWIGVEETTETEPAESTEAEDTTVAIETDGEEDDETEETVKGGDQATEKESEKVTTEKAEAPTEAENEKDPAETDKASGGEKETDAVDESGCGSSIGFGAISLIAVAGAFGFVAYKKKED